MKNNINNEIVTILKVVKKGKKYQVITNIDELECLEEQLVDDRIFKGKNFTLSEWEEVKKHQEVGFYFSKTLNYLSYKLRTTKEIIDYLKENNADYVISKQVIEKLVDYRLLDDTSYTKQYIETQIKNKKGPKLIEFNLRQKGIGNKDLELVYELYSIEEQKDNIYLIIEKELPKLKTYPIVKQKEKIKSKLLRNGFLEPHITNTLNLFKLEADVINRLEKDLNLLIRKEYPITKIKQKLYQKGYSMSDINSCLKNVIND